MQHSTLSPAASPRRWTDILITVAGLIGLALFMLLYDQAFPSAALDLKLSRAEIEQRAWAFLDSRGYRARDYEFVLTFHEDGWASYYLQRTLGVAETNRRVRAEHLPVWSWSARWFKPLQKEEYALSLSPDGQVIGFSHSIMEDAPGARLTQERARQLAEEYVSRDRGWTLADWEPMTSASNDQPGGRADHHFEWKKRAYAIGESELRMGVDVQGDRVGGYGYWIKVPEAFTRNFSEQQNRAGFVNNLSYMIGFIGLGLAIGLAYMLAMWRGLLRWHTGLVIVTLAALVVLLSALNDLWQSRAWYDTTQDYALFWLERVIAVGLSTAYTGGSLLVFWSGARYLSKLAWPRQDKILPRGDDGWIRLARSSWRGLMMGGIKAAYIVLFYVIATRLLGGWTPLDSYVPGAYATPLPFLGPVEAGLLPALREELMFRLAGISVILWLARKVRLPEWLARALALAVPGLLWAFAHVSYVRDPFYLRGVELGIAAILIYGLFFMWFDLTTTMMSHYFWNAGLGALPLLRSGQPGFVLSGVIVVLTMFLPILPGAVMALRRRWRGSGTAVPSIELVSATDADVPQLKAWACESVDWESLLSDASGVVICLRAGNELIGAAAGRLDAEGRGHIQSVYVLPAWRRRYRGSWLVDELCRLLQARGAREVDVTAPAHDRAATAFWAGRHWRTTAQTLSMSYEPPRPIRLREAAARVWSGIKASTRF